MGNRKNSNGAHAPAEILEITTAPKSAAVRIDGELYELCRPGNLLAAKRARKAMGIVKRIMDAEDDAITPALEKEFADAFGVVTSVILPTAPTALLAKLTDADRINLLAVFIETTPGTKLPRPTSTPTPSSRPDSKGSTAAARTTG